MTYRPIYFFSPCFLLLLFFCGCREEETNYTKGIKTFIQKAKLRRKDRENCKEGDEIKPEHVNIENMLMGCASYEKKFVWVGLRIFFLFHLFFFLDLRNVDSL